MDVDSKDDDDELKVVGVKLYPKEEDSESVYSSSTESSYESEKVVNGALDGWFIKLNKTTNNSYILYNSEPVQKVQNGKVYYTDFEVPTTWKLELQGLGRPVYYSAKYNGWILGLRFKDELINAGAVLK